MVLCIFSSRNDHVNLHFIYMNSDFYLQRRLANIHTWFQNSNKMHHVKPKMNIFCLITTFNYEKITNFSTLCNNYTSSYEIDMLFLVHTNIHRYRQTHFHEIWSWIHACGDQSNLQHVISLKTNFMGMSKI